MARVLSGEADFLRRDPIALVLLTALAVGFYASPWPPVYGACFLLLAGLTVLRLDLALALIPLFAPYFMQPKYTGHLTFAPTEILLGLDALAALAVVISGVGPHPSWRTLLRSPFLPAACLFLVAAGVSTVLAADRHVALHAFRERVLDPLLYFALVLLFVRSRAGWWWIVAALLTSAAALGLIGMGQFVLHRDLSTVGGTGIERVQALYGSPDNLGLFLDRVIPVWFALALGGFARKGARLVWWLLGVLLAVTLALTFSVGAWLAVGVACLVILTVARPWGRWVAVACIILAAGVAGVKSHAVARAFQAGHANSTQARVWVWQSSMQMVRDHPLVGVGPDNFLHYYAPTRHQNRWQEECTPGLGYIQPQAGAEPCLSHPHDELLDFWLSTGIAGLLAYLWLLYVFWSRWLTLHRGSTQLWSGPLLLGVGAGMLAAILHGLIDNSYFLVDLSLLFWLFCALVSWLTTERTAVPASTVRDRAGAPNDRITAPERAAPSRLARLLRTGNRIPGVAR